MYVSSYFVDGKRKIDTITDLSYSTSFFRVLDVTESKTNSQIHFPWQTPRDILKSKQKQPKAKRKGNFDEASEPCQMQLFSERTQIRDKEGPLHRKLLSSMERFPSFMLQGLMPRTGEQN